MVWRCSNQNLDERIEDLIPLGVSTILDGERQKRIEAEQEFPPAVVEAMRSLL